jgi:hypothetical protein
MYLILDHTTSSFSLFLAYYGSSSMLQYLVYNSSILTFSVSVSTTILDLTILEFIFWTTKLRK